MRKLCTWMLAVAAVLTSCQKDEYASGGKGGGEVDVRFSASLPEGFTTYSSDQGGVSNLTGENMRFILEVFDKSGASVKRDVKNVGTARTATFDVRLLAKEYDFVFWADFAADGTSTANRYYDAQSLRTIGIIKESYDGNNEARDAYTAVYPVDLRENGANVTNITLKRPFGKVRVVAADIPNGQAWVPTRVTVAYKDPIPAGYDALAGKVTAATMKGGYTAALGELEGENGAKVLSWDYVLDDGKSHGFTLTADDETGANSFSREIATVPVVKNKLTTLKGNILTNSASMSVSVDDAFETPGIDQDIVDVVLPADATPAQVAAAVGEALKSAANVRVANEVKSGDADAPVVTIPDEASDKPQISLNFAGGVTTTAEKPLTINAPEGYSGRIEVTTTSASESESQGVVTVNAPNATVVIDGKVAQVSVTSGDNTTIVAKGAVVDKLTVEKGNVKVYGTVKEVVKNSSDYKVYLVIGEGTDRPVSGTVVKDALAWKYGDGLILTGGNYPLNCNAPAEGYQDGTVCFYLPVTKKGYVIKGEEGQRAVLYGDEEKPNADWNYQNLITVFAEDVTIENLTLMPKKEINKLVEAWNNQAANFTLRGCTVTSNTIKNYEKNAGSIYIESANATIENNVIEYAGITVRANCSATVTGNTFRYGSAHDGWMNACVSSRGDAVLENNVFLNIAPAADGNTPVEAKGDGTLTLSTGNKFPDGRVYWITADNGRILVDGNAWCVPSGLNAAIGAATAGSTIRVSAGTYAGGVVNVNKQVTIEGYGDKPVVSGARFDISADGVVLRNLTVDYDSTYCGNGQDHLIWVRGANVTVDGCVVKNSLKSGCSGHPASWSAIYLGSGDGFTLTNSTVELISAKGHKSLYQGTHRVENANPCLIKGNTILRNMAFDYPVNLTIADNDFGYTYSAVSLLGGKNIAITGNNFKVSSWDNGKAVDVQPGLGAGYENVENFKVNGNNFNSTGLVSNATAGVIDATGNYWKQGKPYVSGNVTTDPVAETPFTR